MRKKIVWIIILLLLILMVTTCHHAGTHLVKNDNPTHADAIVLLMGSIADRVLQITDLYHQGKAGKVILVEESMGAYRKLEERGVELISNSTQVKDALAELGIPEDSITVLPGDATSTQMEALIVRDYLKTNPSIDTLILVSSSPHMRRASMIFMGAVKTLPQPVTALTSPSAYTNFNAEKWWKDREGIQRVGMEYVKILNFVVFERGDLK